MKFDDTDMAYFAMGVKIALQDIGGLNEPLDHGGEIGFVESCIDAARFVEFELPDDFEGVFAYEVAEPLGTEVARALLKGPDEGGFSLDLKAFAQTTVERLIEEVKM